MNKKLDKNLFINLPLTKNYSSRKDWEIACWREISRSKELLDSLTTSYERHNLIARAAAINGIYSGKTYRQIDKELWLSQQTISGIKKSLNEKEYKSYLTRSKTERKKKMYSSVPKRKPKREWHEGRPRKTKYGIIYLPQ